MRLEPDSWKREVPETDYRGARTGSTRIYASDPTKRISLFAKQINFPARFQRAHASLEKGLDILELFASEPAGLTKSYFRNAQFFRDWRESKRLGPLNNRLFTVHGLK